jgi:precorrin-6Y C5,15-methyltransferase (decarboxylating)
VLDAAIAALRAGGRLVVNAVTLETEALLIARHAGIGGTLTRIAIERAEPIGTMTAWRPALPVTQWCWIKSQILFGDAP